jgi:hypothetical protein
METEHSLRGSQKPATGSYPQKNEDRLYLNTLLLEDVLINLQFFSLEQMMGTDDVSETLV